MEGASGGNGNGHSNGHAGDEGRRSSGGVGKNGDSGGSSRSYRRRSQSATESTLRGAFSHDSPGEKLSGAGNVHNNNGEDENLSEDEVFIDARQSHSELHDVTKKKSSLRRATQA